jgi:hypothetical protein
VQPVYNVDRFSTIFGKTIRRRGLLQSKLGHTSNPVTDRRKRQISLVGSLQNATSSAVEFTD